MAATGSQLIKFWRGLAAAQASATGVAGEPMWATDTQQLFVGDGTAGGVEIGYLQKLTVADTAAGSNLVETGSITGANEITFVGGSGIDIDVDLTSKEVVITGAAGASTLEALDDTVITSVADGEVLVWSTSDWINQTLTEAGIAAANHAHLGAGTSSVALGEGAVADANDTVAIGHLSDANGTNAVGIGHSSQALESNCIAVGEQAEAGQTAGGVLEIDAIAIGYFAKAYETAGVAIGKGATTGSSGSSAGPGSIAIGQSAKADEQFSISIGQNSDANGISAVAVGDTAQAKEVDCIAIGTATAGQTAGANAEHNAIAIGNSATAYEIYSIAIGRSAKAGNSSTSVDPNSVAIGYQAQATGARSVSIGQGVQNSNDDELHIGTSNSNKIVLNSSEQLGLGPGNNSIDEKLHLEDGETTGTYLKVENTDTGTGYGAGVKLHTSKTAAVQDWAVECNGATSSLVITDSTNSKTPFKITTNTDANLLRLGHQATDTANLVGKLLISDDNSTTVAAEAFHLRETAAAATIALIENKNAGDYDAGIQLKNTYDTSTEWDIINRGSDGKYVLEYNGTEYFSIGSLGGFTVSAPSGEIAVGKIHATDSTTAQTAALYFQNKDQTSMMGTIAGGHYQLRQDSLGSTYGPQITLFDRTAAGTATGSCVLGASTGVAGAADDYGFVANNYNGSTTDTNAIVSTAGNFWARGSITCAGSCCGSDIRFKENLTELWDASGILGGLTGYRFDWKDTGKSDIGLIAQDVELMAPELVTEEKIDPTDDKTEYRKYLNYNGIVGVLVEAFNEQQKRIEELERRLDEHTT